MTTLGPESFYGAAVPAGVLLAALLLDAVFGGIPGLRQAFALPETTLGAVVSWLLLKRLNRVDRCGP